MVTADYAEPRELVTDPVKPYKPGTFRPTVRVWDVTAPAAPRLVSVARMPKGPKESAQGQGNMAIMEAAKPYAPAKGMFSGASCGGGIFFTPDITALAGDSSAAWNQVFDDDMAVLHAPGDDRVADRTREDGGNPGSTDNGHVDCRIDTMAEIRRGQGDEADCPRLVFSNSFVARTGVDRNHRMYVVDVDPASGALAYDQSFQDENDGVLGADFNRRNWPNHPDAGFYKPHAMVWVCPPGLCPT